MHDLLTMISRWFDMSSICETIFSDKNNSKLNPYYLFGMLQKTQQISCKTKSSLFYFEEIRNIKSRKKLSCQYPAGISDIMTSSKPNQRPRYKT